MATEAIARVLRSGEPAILMIAGAGLEAKALADAHRVASVTGAKRFAPTFNRLIQRGRSRHPIALLPYPIDQAVAALATSFWLARKSRPGSSLTRTNRAS